MAPKILSCGSNASSHLALNHSSDVSTFTLTQFHPSIPPSLLDSARVIDLVSASSHSLLLLATEDGGPNLLLGAGTNTLGQLGPRCALWDDVRAEARWKVVDLLGSLGLGGDWEAVKIAATWTTSFVVFQRIPSTESSPAEGEGGGSTAAASTNDENDERDPAQILVSCGSNDFGELGTSAPTTLDAPSPIPISQASQKPTIVDLGLKAGERITMLKGGQRHVVAVIEGRDGRQRMIGWGAARKGELSVISSASELGSGQAGSSRGAGTGTADIPTLTGRRDGSSNGKGKGKGKGKATANPATLPPTLIDLSLEEGERIKDISLGASHTLALLSSGRILGWGSDAKGQLTGIGRYRDVRGISASWNGSYTLSGSTVHSQGSNSHSQLVHGDGGTGKVEITEKGWTVEKIVAGSEHLLALATRGDQEQGVWTGGWNEHGNLGLGDQVDRERLCRVSIEGMGKGKLGVRGVWGGCATSWIWMG